MKQWFLWVLLAVVGGTGCASDDKNRDLVYESNAFWSYEGTPPAHPDKKAHLDFFDKVCSGDRGQAYQCHYTDDP